MPADALTSTRATRLSAGVRGCRPARCWFRSVVTLAAPLLVLVLLALTDASPANGAPSVRDTLTVERSASGTTGDWDAQQGILRPRSPWMQGRFSPFSAIDFEARPSSQTANRQCGEEGTVIDDLNGDGLGDLIVGCANVGVHI